MKKQKNVVWILGALMIVGAGSAPRAFANPPSCDEMADEGERIYQEAEQLQWQIAQDLGATGHSTRDTGPIHREEQSFRARFAGLSCDNPTYESELSQLDDVLENIDALVDH